MEDKWIRPFAPVRPDPSIIMMFLVNMVPGLGERMISRRRQYAPQQLVAGGAAASAAGEFSLQETGALLQRARVVVSGDTGIMHMATGVGTPVVALFGPTVTQFGFFPYVAPSVVLERELSCRPCSATGTAACPLGHHRCLADIMPADVAAAVSRLVA